MNPVTNKLDSLYNFRERERERLRNFLILFSYEDWRISCRKASKANLVQLFSFHSTFMKEHMELDSYDCREKNLGRFKLFFSMRAGKPVVE